MRIKSEKDFFSGLLFMLGGLAFAGGAINDKIGEQGGARMGAGHFSLLLGILLALLGLVLTFTALVVETEDGDKIGSIAWKPLFFIFLSPLVFGLMLGGLPSVGWPSMGLVVAIYATTFIAALAGEEFVFKEVLVVATILAVASYVAFVVLLKLQFPPWPAFIAG